MTQITRDALNQAISAVGAAIEAADPHGKAHGLRTLLTYGLYKLFDDLRGQKRAFDREAFMAGLRRAQMMAETHPVVLQAESPAAAAETIEVFTADLYSRCWTYYTDQEFLDMAKLFDKRFVMSGISLDLKGKKCIDLGCGSGRYVIAMADAGASESWGFDLSERAIADGTARAQRLGYSDRCHFQAGSVLELPFEDESFDFVSCNGVLHHTTDPKKGLAELARITRKDGIAYVMLYGSGELWWDLTDMMRSVMACVPRGYAFSALELLSVAPGKVFNYMDHVFVPCREVISHAEFQDRLRAVGFKSWQIMERGEMIDSAERKTLFAEDADLVGEADLRYVCRF
ncbi:class I SAM-dependent methyltransferase [Insolitispirillum peregrinum]|uniref:class I SAM-dependent methyltransferase n=1 Tax=Insolitispirillum peregrinum TaxID=80876 RepID=UPI003615027F